MPDNQHAVRIDLQNMTLAIQVAIINAIFQARHVLEEKGLKMYIRKKQVKHSSRL